MWVSEWKAGGGGVSFQDFEISNDDNGKPVLTLTGKALQLANAADVRNVHITISDERHYAVATVILES